MANYFIHSKPGCPHCVRAKQALKIRGLGYVETLYTTPEAIEVFKAEGHRTFPQVYLGTRHIGGADQLLAHLAQLVEADEF